MRDELIEETIRIAKRFRYRPRCCSRCKTATVELIRVGMDTVHGMPKGHKDAPRYCHGCFDRLLQASYKSKLKQHAEIVEQFRNQRDPPLISREDFVAHVWRRVVNFRCDCGMHIGYLRRSLGVEPTQCPACSAKAAQQRHKTKHGIGVRQATCVECGGEFTAKRSTATFCSAKCRVAASRSGNPDALAKRQEREAKVEAKRVKKAEYDAYCDKNRYVAVRLEWLRPILNRLHKDFGKRVTPLKIRDRMLMDDSIMHYIDTPFVILSVDDLIKTSGRTEPEWIEACYDVARQRYGDRKKFYDKCQAAIRACKQRGSDRKEYIRKSEEARYEKMLEDILKGHYGDSERAKDLATLGLSGNHDNDAVKTAYRAKSKQHHPDKGGDEAEFVKLKDAYERLRRDE